MALRTGYNGQVFVVVSTSKKVSATIFKDVLLTACFYLYVPSCFVECVHKVKQLMTKMHTNSFGCVFDKQSTINLSKFNKKDI